MGQALPPPGRAWQQLCTTSRNGRQHPTMTTAQPPGDPDRSTIVSRSPGLAYERVRDARPSHLDQSLAAKVTAAGVLLAVLAAGLAPVLVGGAGAGDGSSISLLAAGACAFLGLAAAGLGALAAYRLAREPLTERRAAAVVAVEDALSYLGLGVGGPLAVSTAAVAGLGWSSAGTGVAPSTVAGIAALLSVAALVGGLALRGRLPRSSARPRFFSLRAEKGAP